MKALRVALAALIGLLFCDPLSLGAEARGHVEHATVSVEMRLGREWCVLDSQVSLEVSATVGQLLSAIEDFDSYPALFPDIKEVRTEKLPEGTLLFERVVVSALGVENTNRFTLRVAAAQTDPGTGVTRVEWTQEKTDGTIDSLGGGWTLEAKGTGQAPLTRVTYRNHSAVPVVVFGQDVVIRMFLGDKMKTTVEAMAKKALSR
jgi:hypothetical protein